MDITLLIFSSSLFLRIDSNDEPKNEYVKHTKKWKVQKLRKFINIYTLILFFDFETG